jgi:peptidoglycan/xylan/chitin deacetylase (PgdA/CDA1 family)
MLADAREPMRVRSDPLLRGWWFALGLVLAAVAAVAIVEAAFDTGPASAGPEHTVGAAQVGCAAVASRVLRFTRARSASVRAGCERYALAAAAAVRRQPPEDRSRILCYHATGTPSWGLNDLSPKRFARQIEWARREGWSFVDARDISAGTAYGRALAITFDDGLASVDQVTPLLADQGIPCTLFVVTDWMDRAAHGDERFLGWDRVGELAASGVTIASHSLSHPNFPHVSDDHAVEELARSRELLSERLGICTDEFAIPLGQSANWTEQLQRQAAAAGYEHVYAQAETTRTPGTVPRTFITKWDSAWIFGSALSGTFDEWEEWV